MSRTTSVTIGPQLDDFVGKLIESGRYGSTSEGESSRGKQKNVMVFTVCHA